MARLPCDPITRRSCRLVRTLVQAAMRAPSVARYAPRVNICVLSGALHTLAHRHGQGQLPAAAGAHTLA
jgi:hypothetical protein